MTEEACGWFDWSSADLLWERTSELAVLACRRGDGKGAAREVERALDLARRQFARGDPRIASGYLSRARLAGEPRSPEAAILLEHARQMLDESWAWLPAAAESSDEQRKIDAARELIAELRGLVDHVHGGEEDPDATRFDIWKRERVRLEAGLRKVAAAALLTVTWPCRARGDA